ncbi:Protein N-acetyltransferase, RimJ/RimL family [Lysobacter sp. yr284]|uniref:GNAT family N-acetyltransferase n=1 Tax=Lysobacter sp. yr284 TaxID=1761791 RepID=UPI00089B5924|nr:GNAT family N-acetyltransferase [Lysobacter sp. yr284]SDY74576.1 Protein N-acetyltransferase, RimJ/RimL family [Lysobacter sp. yr284]
MPLPLSPHSQAIADFLAALDGFPVLQGSRVRLRGPREDDAAALFALFGDARVTRFWSRPPMQDIAEARELIEQIHAGRQARTLLNWAIADETDALIGTCTLFRFDAAHRRAEIGYALHSDHWGRGLAREATALALDWAVDTVGLHRIDAGIDPDNQASRALLHRHGFLTEGRQRESFFVGERVTDSELLGLLASDWRQRREAAAAAVR